MIMLNSSSQVLQCTKLWPIINWPINLSTGLPYGLFTLRLQNNSSVQDICLYRCLTAYRVGYPVTFWCDMTRTGVSSSPLLEILHLEYMAVLESNWNQLVNVLFVKSGKKTCICHSHKYKFSPNVWFFHSTIHSACIYQTLWP